MSEHMKTRPTNEQAAHRKSNGFHYTIPVEMLENDEVRVIRNKAYIGLPGISLSKWTPKHPNALILQE